jgi:exodeoxyribonuclease V alpha subunit
LKAILSQFEFEPLDWQLASTVSALSHNPTDELRLAIALSSKRRREGHVCVSLSEVAGQPLWQTEQLDDMPAVEASWPRLQTWMERLHGSDAVTQPERLDPARPLVLVGDRLYLTRYYLHERALIERVRERVVESLDLAEPAPIRRAIESLYAPLWPESERQRLAIAVSLLSRLCIVTGGPGTGKTTAIVRLLAVLVQQALTLGHDAPRALLLAPTGKAASRISDAIRQSKDRLALSEPVRQCIPDSASTIHRVLGPGARPDYTGHCRLAANVVIVDEASMVDLALMRRLFDACVNVPRLVLLGDSEQLESVLAGSVLAELTATAHQGYGQQRAASILALTGLDVPGSGQAIPHIDDCRVELTVSHRFQSDSGIGRLAQAVRLGQSERAWQTLMSGSTDVSFVELPSQASSAIHAILEIAENGYGELRSAKTPEDALAVLSCFRILCGHRHGPFGIEPINEKLSNARSGPEQFGLAPILITENAPELSLFNGDMGVIGAAPEAHKRRAAYLLDPSGKVRILSINRLPAFELAFATTVHKSQGSEVDRVVVVLPPLGSPLATRELLYTAVTRARKACTICGTKAALWQACERRSRRSSGLAQGLALASDSLF